MTPTEVRLIDFFVFDAAEDIGRFSRATTDEVAEHFGIDPKAAYRVLNALAKKGRLTKARDIMKRHKGRTAVGYQWWEYYWQPGDLERYEQREKPLKESTMTTHDDNEIEQAEAAGEEYAYDQINGEYFMDWVRDQLIEARHMPQDKVLPLETKQDALVIARNMLQQLKWDTRDLRAREIERLLVVDRVTPDIIDAFFEGFRRTLDASRDWLADELLEMERGLRSGVEEARRGPEPGPTSLIIDGGLEARRIKVGGPSKTLRATTETWVVHQPGDPGNSVLQVDIFKPEGQLWTAWTGNFIRARDREIAKRVAAARNGTGEGEHERGERHKQRARAPLASGPALTSNERAVLLAIANSEYQHGSGENLIGNYVYSEGIADESGIGRRSIAGVFSSLSKKNLIHVAVGPRKSDDTVALTAAGVEALPENRKR
jgi:DNA-binding MarR family transcriptional regulator